MNTVKLYNNDGTLSTQAQSLLSPKPPGMSREERRSEFRFFKNQLSTEELKEFNRIKARQQAATWRLNNPEKHRKSQEKWIKNNPEKSKQSSLRWHSKNPIKSKHIAKSWRKNNPTKVNEAAKEWYRAAKLTDPEKTKKRNAESNKKWRTKHPTHTTEYLKVYHKQRRAKDPLYRLQCNMRIMGNRVVKQLSLGKKPANTEKWQGCSADELKAHLESLFSEGMSWDNYGEWHVDHIRPVSSFTAEEAMQINHYTNLQPLWAEDNIKKSDNY